MLKLKTTYCKRSEWKKSKEISYRERRERRKLTSKAHLRLVPTFLEIMTPPNVEIKMMTSVLKVWLWFKKYDPHPHKVVTDRALTCNLQNINMHDFRYLFIFLKWEWDISFSHCRWKPFSFHWTRLMSSWMCIYIQLEYYMCMIVFT